jgi:integrase
MAIVKELNQTYVDHELRCPEGKAQGEVVDPQRSGLYIEVRASRPSEGTYYLRCKDANGKTCRRRIGRTTEISLDDARTAAVTLKATMGQSGDVVAVPIQQIAPTVTNPAAPDGSMSLDDFMTAKYFPYIKGRKRSAPRDAQLYRLRIKDKFGHLPLRAIKRMDVEFFGDELVEAGLSHASANQHMQLMRRVCNLAVSWEYLDRNALTRIKLLPLDNRRDTWLKEDEVTRLVEVLKTHNNRMVSLIVLFLLSTGARLGEALRAEWKQVDLANSVWTIPATNSKSKKVHHKPLNVNALKVLEHLNSKGCSPYLFPSPATGKPYTTITRAWYVVRKAAELPATFRIHDLRHTFASRLVSAGRSIYEVKTLLGHADVRTSERYSHLSMERAQEASNAAAFAMG